MPSQKAVALVIRTRDYGEAHRLVTVLTPGAGALTLVALNAHKSRRRFPNCLEPLSLVRLTYTDKPHRDLGRLESCELLEPHPGLRRDLPRLAAAACLAEVAVEVIGAADRLPDIFAALQAALVFLSQGLPPDSLLVSFLMRLLTLAGYGPRWLACRLCGRPPAGPLWFHPVQGVVTCKDCLLPEPGPLHPLSLGAWKLLTLAQTLPLAKISRLRFPPPAARQSLALLTAFLRHLLGRDLKSLAFLAKIQEQSPSSAHPDRRPPGR